MPFSTRIGGATITLADSTKAILGIAIAASANMPEMVSCAVQSIPTGQWETASSLAFTRRQTIWMIIQPQYVNRILPPWMNLYALALVSTPLRSIIGMTAVEDTLAPDRRADLLLPAYGCLLLLFFAFSYPIARLTVLLDRKFSAGYCAYDHQQQ